jgi:hypothetical protein
VQRKFLADQGDDFRLAFQIRLGNKVVFGFFKSCRCSKPANRYPAGGVRRINRASKDFLHTFSCIF